MAPLSTHSQRALFAYAHTAGSCPSIIGGAFIPRGAWPDEYAAGYLFSDFLCGTIWILRGGTAEDAKCEPFATGLSLGIVTLEFRASDLYYVNYLGLSRKSVGTLGGGRADVNRVEAGARRSAPDGGR